MHKLQIELRKFAKPEKIPLYKKFFKTGEGEYGEGDEFIGVTVPDSRKVARANIDISYEEANFIKDTFVETYALRDVTLVPVKLSEHTEDVGAEIHFETIDQIVISQLASLDGSYDKNVLIEIYNGL